MKKIFMLIIAVCILYGILMLFIVFMKPSSNHTTTTNTPTLFPTPTPYVQTQQPHIHPSTQEGKLLQAVDNRQTLSATDSAAKNTIITSLNNQPGSPAITDEYQIDYVPTLDLFQVEITTTAYQQAKQDATTWFLTHGFTLDGLCKLPVEFYLNWNIRQELHLNNFNPLAEGC